jgi:hypothetical protein
VKKQVLIVCAIVMFLFCLTSTASMASDKCIILGYKWGTSPDYVYTYGWLYENGAVVNDEGSVGTWEKFGGSFKIQYTDGCQPLYAGTKKQGFFECTSGSGPTGPNYYTIKGTNKKNCELITTTGITSVKEGPSGASPE